MGYRIDFIGMVNFFDLNPQGRLVLLPNGRTNLPDRVPPHFASFFVEESQFKGSTNWDFEQDPVLTHRGIREFPIDTPSKIEITGQGEQAARGSSRDEAEKSELDTSLHAHIVPRLREIDPDIRIVPEEAETIAQMPIRYGVLEALMFGGGIVSRLTVSFDTGSVTITATPDDGSGQKSFTVAEGAEIVLSNISDPFEKHGGEDVHFQLYAKLDKERKRDKLMSEPRLDIVPPRLEMVHPYLKFILGPVDFPMPGCSNTGCCAGQLVTRSR